jgi:hypothetical protein
VCVFSSFVCVPVLKFPLLPFGWILRESALCKILDSTYWYRLPAHLSSVDSRGQWSALRMGVGVSGLRRLHGRPRGNSRRCEILRRAGRISYPMIVDTVNSLQNRI